MDHEFGSTQLNPDQVGWDWFGLQFDDGTELMLYIIRKAGGQSDPFSAGTWVGADGRSAPSGKSDFTMGALDHWVSPQDQRRYPIKWRLASRRWPST